MIAGARVHLLTLVVSLVFATPSDGAAAAPSVTAAFTGPVQLVADYEAIKDRCDPADTPDEPARAFRDSQNNVHLIVSISNTRALIGPSLDRVTQNCHVLHASPQDGYPQDFSDNHWLMSFYTADGINIAALVHTEFDGFAMQGVCSPKSLKASYANCWWNTITYAFSSDGGQNFSEPPPPKNLVAAPPYPFDPNNLKGPDGYNGPTEIVRSGGYFYALINDWPFMAQQFGPCLMRTANPFDPQSWRAWDGTAFTVQFVDPYTAQNVNPAQHVCAPVYAGDAQTLVVDQTTGDFIATSFAEDTRYGPKPGLYIFVSPDLIHWSRATYGEGQVAGSESYATASDARYSYGYFSLLDPTSSDLDFATVSATPYAYFVRFDADNDPPYARSIFRRPLQLTIAP